MEILQVCSEKECENKPLLKVTIGSHTYDFCCQKGFEKSLAAFNQFLKKKK